MSPVSGTHAFLICAFRFADSQVVFIPRAQPHAQSLSMFLFPTVFGTNHIIMHFDILLERFLAACSVHNVRLWNHTARTIMAVGITSITWFSNSTIWVGCLTRVVVQLFLLSLVWLSFLYNWEVVSIFFCSFPCLCNYTKVTLIWGVVSLTYPFTFFCTSSPVMWIRSWYEILHHLLLEVIPLCA